MIDFGNVKNIIDIALACTIIVSILVLCFAFRVSIFSKVVISILSACIITFFIFQMHLCLVVICIILILYVYSMFFFRGGAIRNTVSKLFKTSTEKKALPDKIIDHQKLYNEIYKCVSACSIQKIGALITFEKHDDLNPLCKNGTTINSPVVSELLMTIFYPGTRLHDGAVIIKNNTIYAASVYFTPTTSALTGKFGSRHRAAIGISEISDAVTVVVSEETGRISITDRGEIEHVTIDEFVDALSEHMSRGE